MATVYIVGYHATSEVALGRPLSGEALTTNTSTYTQSAAITGTPKINRIEISLDTDHLMDKTAAAADGTGFIHFIPANAVVYHWVQDGDIIALKELA